jgi:hypothetical protein
VTLSPPATDEAPDYFFRYIRLVPAGDIRSILAAQLDDMGALIAHVSEDAAAHRYAPDKWSLRQVLAHVNDCERLFTFRALWFARGFDAPLPSFDQDVAARHDRADARSWSGLGEEFGHLRAATISLFRHLPDEAWTRRGVASGGEFSVKAFAWIAAGHVFHHATIMRERYLPTRPASERR